MSTPKKGTIQRVQLGKGTALVAVIQAHAFAFTGRRWFPKSCTWGAPREYDAAAVIEEADYNAPDVARALIGLMGVAR